MCGQAHAFGDNRGFQRALQQQEAADLQYIHAVLPGQPFATTDGGACVGVRQLRLFLERLLRERCAAPSGESGGREDGGEGGRGRGRAEERGLGWSEGRW